MEHCVVRGQPEQVERCVLHMDIASLDFSQVAPRKPNAIARRCTPLHSLQPLTAFSTHMCHRQLFGAAHSHDTARRCLRSGHANAVRLTCRW